MLVSRTWEMSGAPLTAVGQFLPLVAMQTHYGTSWWVRMTAVLVLWLAWVAGRSSSGRGGTGALYALALAVIAYTRSATGHAGDGGMFMPAVWIDWLHLLAGGVWVGSLVAWSLIVFPALLRNEAWQSDAAQRQLAVNGYGRLSALSGVAVAVIALSGAYDAWEGLGTIAALGQSPYGQILLVKVTLVGGMLGLGAHNRYVKLPHLDQWAGQWGKQHPLVNKLPGFSSWPYRTDTEASDPLQRCARTVNIQALLGIAVLTAAALLHHAMPPADKHRSFGELPSVNAAVELASPARGPLNAAFPVGYPPASGRSGPHKQIPAGVYTISMIRKALQGPGQPPDSAARGCHSWKISPRPKPDQILPSGNTPPGTQKTSVSPNADPCPSAWSALRSGTTCLTASIPSAERHDAAQRGTGRTRGAGVGPFTALS